LCDSYQRGDSRTTKIIEIKWLVIAVDAAQVLTSEGANIFKFARFQTFAQTAINVLNP
jgi:hypothetical protein